MTKASRCCQTTCEVCKANFNSSRAFIHHTAIHLTSFQDEDGTRETQTSEDPTDQLEYDPMSVSFSSVQEMTSFISQTSKTMPFMNQRTRFIPQLLTNLETNLETNLRGSSLSQPKLK